MAQALSSNIYILPNTTFPLGKPSLKKTVFYEKNSQTGRADLPDFKKPYFFLQRVKQMGKSDQKKGKTSQNPYRAGGSAFYEFFHKIPFFFKTLVSLKKCN